MIVVNRLLGIYFIRDGANQLVAVMNDNDNAENYIQETAQKSYANASAAGGDFSNAVMTGDFDIRELGNEVLVKLEEFSGGHH
jgi:hypothetical protein